MLVVAGAHSLARALSPISQAALGRRMGWELDRLTSKSILALGPPGLLNGRFTFGYLDGRRESGIKSDCPHISAPDRHGHTAEHIPRRVWVV